MSERKRDRILYNRGGESIDEIVVQFIDGTLHIEQMDDHLYSVLVYKNGATLALNMAGGGNVCRLTDHWDEKWKWDEDETHA